MKKIVYACVFNFALMMTVAQVHAQTGTLTLEDGVAANQSIDKHYELFITAYDELDTEKFRSIYTDDAFYLQPKAKHYQGIDPLIQNGFKDWFDWMKEGEGTLSISFTIIARELHEKLGYDIGYYSVSEKRPGEDDQTYTGKFVVVLKKQDGGDWRFQVDAYNTLE